MAHRAAVLRTGRTPETSTRQAPPSAQTRAPWPYPEIETTRRLGLKGVRVEGALCAGLTRGVPMGAVPALSWCGEVSLGGEHICIIIIYICIYGAVCRGDTQYEQNPHCYSDYSQYDYLRHDESSRSAVREG